MKFHFSIEYYIYRLENNLIVIIYTMIWSGISMGPTGGVPRVALGQEHITKDSAAALRLEPPNRLRQTILTLPRGQVADALRHTLNILRPANPERAARPVQAGQHRVAAAHLVAAKTIGRPAFLHDHALVLHPDERNVVVFDEAALQLHGAAACLGAERGKMGDCLGDAGGAVRHG